MSFLFGRKSNIPPNATFMLTQVGRVKVQEFKGDPKSRVMVVLETSGTSDVDEIARASGLRRGAVERLIPVLIRGGYIKYVSGDTAEGE